MAGFLSSTLSPVVKEAMPSLGRDLSVLILRHASQGSPDLTSVILTGDVGFLVHPVAVTFQPGPETHMMNLREWHHLYF